MKTLRVNSETAKVNQSTQVRWIMKKFILLNLQEPANGASVRSTLSPWRSGLFILTLPPLPGAASSTRMVGRRDVGTRLHSRVLFCVCVCVRECAKIAKPLPDYDDGRCANNSTMRQGISCDKSNILIRVRGIWIYSYSFHPNPSWNPRNPS